MALSAFACKSAKSKDTRSNPRLAQRPWPRNMSAMSRLERYESRELFASAVAEINIYL